MPCGSMLNPMSIGAKQDKRIHLNTWLRMDTVCLKLHQNDKEYKVVFSLKWSEFQRFDINLDL